MSKLRKTSAQTSNADRVIDAIEEVRESERPRKGYVCDKCGNTSYEVRSPLGGPKIYVCTACGHKSYKGAYSVSPLLPENTNHKQGVARGPIKSAVKPKRDKHIPSFRNKGKPK